MEKIINTVIVILQHITKYVLIVYFAIEKYVHRIIMPFINRMKLHCWIGTIFLFVLGYFAAKIF